MIKNIIISSVLLGLLSCATQSNISVLPTPNPTASANINSTSRYDLPLKMFLKIESDVQNPKLVLEIKNNILYYNLNSNTFGFGEEIKNDIKQVNLSNEQIEELKKLIKDADLDTLAKDDTKVPENSPQTLEIRSIEGITLNVDSKEKTFFINDREYIHSEKYLNAIRNLRDQIKSFKDRVIAKNAENVNKAMYNLPLKIFLKSEGDPQNPKTLFEVKDNLFYYNMNSEIFGENVKDDIKQLSLTNEQTDEIKKFINDADLETLSKEDTKVPENSPQTKELRSIEGIVINVNGRDKTFFRNDREYIHTDKYKKAMENLRYQITNYKAKIISKETELNKEFNLKIGESINVKSENISFKVLDLKEESRCPDNARCIQAGQAVFNLSLFSNVKTESFMLSTNKDTEKTIDSYTIKLVKLFPESFSTNKTPINSDYVLTLKVEKK